MIGIKRYILGLAAIALAQTLFLGHMMWDRITLLRTGAEITLPVAPVDPRDLFRGRYVTLAYDISRLDLEALEGDNNLRRGDTIYVALKPDGNIWRATAVYRQHPGLQTDTGLEPDDSAAPVIIRGQITWIERKKIPAGTEENACPDCRYVNVLYGIEDYFVEETAAPKIEEMRDKAKIIVIAAIAEDGEAAIKGLRIDGELEIHEPIF